MNSLSITLLGISIIFLGLTAIRTNERLSSLENYIHENNSSLISATIEVQENAKSP